MRFSAWCVWEFDHLNQRLRDCIMGWTCLLSKRPFVGSAHERKALSEFKKEVNFPENAQKSKSLKKNQKYDYARRNPPLTRLEIVGKTKIKNINKFKNYTIFPGKRKNIQIKFHFHSFLCAPRIIFSFSHSNVWRRRKWTPPQIHCLGMEGEGARKMIKL